MLITSRRAGPTFNSILSPSNQTQWIPGGRKHAEFKSFPLLVAKQNSAKAHDNTVFTLCMHLADLHAIYCLKVMDNDRNSYNNIILQACK